MITLNNKQKLFFKKICICPYQVLTFCSLEKISQKQFDTITTFLETFFNESHSQEEINAYHDKLDTPLSNIFSQENLPTYKQDNETPTKLFDFFYIIFKNILNYKDGLLKQDRKSAIIELLISYSPYECCENGIFTGPRVYLCEKLITDEELNIIKNKFNDKIIIYRGMSKAEYDSNLLGQFWSFTKQVAQNFAKNNDTDTTPKILVEATISINDILLYIPEERTFEEEQLIISLNVTPISKRIITT